MHRKTAAAVVTVVALLTSGCSSVSAQLDGTEVGSREPAESSLSLVVTRKWAVVDGLLSIVVQNVTDRTLTYASGVINARTEDNELVAASIESDRSCCEIVDLAPGQEYGFYLDVGADAADISRVDVSYRDISWAPVGDAPAEPAVRARPVGLEQGASGAVVRADLVSDGPSTEVVAQAFVSDEAGEFLAVVSGRWTCLANGTRPIDMQLFHPLPEGARVDQVVVHPVSDDPTRPGPDCSSGAAS